MLFLLLYATSGLLGVGGGCREHLLG